MVLGRSQFAKTWRLQVIFPYLKIIVLLFPEYSLHIPICEVLKIFQNTITELKEITGNNNLSANPKDKAKTKDYIYYNTDYSISYLSSLHGGLSSLYELHQPSVEQLTERIELWLPPFSLRTETRQTSFMCQCWTKSTSLKKYIHLIKLNWIYSNKLKMLTLES